MFLKFLTKFQVQHQNQVQEPWVDLENPPHFFQICVQAFVCLFECLFYVVLQSEACPNLPFKYLKPFQAFYAHIEIIIAFLVINFLILWS